LLEVTFGEKSRPHYAYAGGKDMEGKRLLIGVGKGSLGSVIMARIPMDVDLLEALEELALREGISKGLILMGIGALKRAVFRNLKHFPETYPIGPADRLYYEVEGPLELTSLSGYVVKDTKGKLLVHAHFSASKVTGERVQVYGGHLGEGTISYVKVAVALAPLPDMPMGKKWVEERKTEDLWVGSPEE
jgi:predicted DNA-binding protein with PD1-like motif